MSIIEQTLILGLVLSYLLVFLYALWRAAYRRVSKPEHRTQYAVRMYEDMEQCEEGLNEMSADGWDLHSWHTEALYARDEESATTSGRRRCGPLPPPGHSSFQLYRVIFTKEVRV